MNPLRQLREVGQSPWSDYSPWGVMAGTLQMLIDEDRSMGMASNPAIFESAISESGDYEKDLRRLAWERTRGKDIYERLASSKHVIGSVIGSGLCYCVKRVDLLKGASLLMKRIVFWKTLSLSLLPFITLLPF